MGFIQEIIDEIKSYGELDEEIVSQLLRNKDYAEGDFRFIGLTDEKIYFSVPEQNLVKWFENPETTIREEKQHCKTSTIFPCSDNYNSLNGFS